MSATTPSIAAIPDGYMRDSAGRLVPVANVKAEHLLEDELVREIHAEGRAIAAQLAQAKAAWFERVATLLELLAQKHGAKTAGAKGNLTLNSYDGTLRVVVANNDQQTFGPELQVAKTLIDECLDTWSQGADPNLKAIIMDAFDVGKEGSVVVSRILGLRRLNIDHPTWQRAMAAIADAIRVDQARTYIRLHQRANQEAPWLQVPLDVAKA